MRQGSLRSFGRCVRLCGLAAIVPGLSRALKGLCALLVYNHIVNTLIWCCHASSIAFHLTKKNTQNFSLKKSKLNRLPLWLLTYGSGCRKNWSKFPPTFLGGVDLPGSRSKSRYSTCLSPFGFTMGLLPPSVVMGAPSFMFYMSQKRCLLSTQKEDWSSVRVKQSLYANALLLSQ